MNELSFNKITQPRSQGLFPGLRVGQGKGPGNEVENYRFSHLLYTELTISFLTGQKGTENIRNQRM